MIDILAFGAHPDDIEFGCGGILVKAVSEGRSVAMVDLTLGERGTNGTPEIRRQEALDAANILGVERIFLDFRDCEIQDTYQGREKIAAVIRRLQPKLVIGPYWKGEGQHPDHIALGAMLRNACRYARFAKILPEQPIHKPEGILHYPHPLHGQADFLIDVSDHIETWTRMMQCHRSQMRTFAFVEWVLSLASAAGVLIGRPYAQPLVKGNPIIVSDLMAISKGTRDL